MRLGGLAWGPADETQWSQRDRAVDFFDVKGDLEALFAPQRLQLRRGRTPGPAPGRSARVLLDGQASASLANCTPLAPGYEISGRRAHRV